LLIAIKSGPSPGAVAPNPPPPVTDSIIGQALAAPKGKKPANTTTSPKRKNLLLILEIFISIIS
jgi:hypothetical protein